MKILDNGIAIVENDSHIGRWIHESGRIDHDLSVEGNILPLLRSHYWIVDAGADVGSHTVRYAQAVPAGRVLAFEPNPEEFECLKHNVRDYGNVECHQTALGNCHECVTLMTCENAGAGYLDPKTKGAVSVLPLDALNLPRLDFFKIDVEGYELFALWGAQKTITAHRPKILVEMNAGTLSRNGVSYSQIFEFLGDMGYEWKSFAQDVDLLKEPMYDLLATPKAT